MNDPPDEVLVSAVLTGDLDAYRTLVERYETAFLRYAIRMLPSRPVAEDIVQDGFLVAYQELASCEHPERFASWCFHIVRNRCHDYLRSPLSRMEGSERLESLPAEGEDLERQVDRADLRRAIARAVAALPPLLREAFVLHHQESLTYPQMAERLDASESALKMRVKRAREALQELLADFEDRAGT